MIDLHCGDCLEIMPALEASSVDLILTDPPYYKVKGEEWDRQWATPQKFLEWLDRCAAEWQRLLKPNGSLYVFASPKMAARVEVMLGERFNVLNRIRWVKDAGWHRKVDKETLRAYLSPWEEIIFCEHYGSDSIAKGEAGYEAKCDELRGFIFEPLRVYLDNERERSGVSVRKVAEKFQERTGSRTITGMAGHWFTRVQWSLPTKENYHWLRDTLSNLNHGGDYLRREYEDLRREYEDLRREYEDLRREYEDLRRPFSVSADVPYTDVWTFPTVAHYPGKHPCEKPLDLLKHIITASSRPGAIVLDCFAGSGNTGIAAHSLGRDAVLIERDKKYFAKMKAETAGALAQLELI